MVIAGVLFGTIVFGGQIFVNLGLSTYEISFFTTIFGFVLLPLVIFKREWKFRRSMISFFLVFGFLGAAIRLLQFGALALGAPVAVVVLLLYTQPLWTVIFGRLFLQEEITKNKIVAVVCVMLGVIAIVNPHSLVNMGGFFGATLALMGGICLGGYVVWGRKGGLMRYHFITTTFGYVTFTFLFLVISYPFVHLITQNPMIVRVDLRQPTIVWLYISLFVLVASLIPHASLFRGIQKVPAFNTGIILLLEPICGSILAAVVLGQPLTFNMVLGGALILISNYLVIRAENQAATRMVSRTIQNSKPN